MREEHRLGVFEKEVLRRIFGAKKDEVTGEWRKLHNKEIHEPYSSPDIILVIKWGIIRWARHVARMERGWRVLVINLRERDHLEDPVADGRIILRWFFRKWYVMA